MPVHRLVPIDPKDPGWRASTRRDVAVVRAGSEERARSETTLLRHVLSPDAIAKRCRR
jgi:hypothetical protein